VNGRIDIHLAYVIKSGTVYPINTHANMENFVKIVLKRFKDGYIAVDDPCSFFPIEQGDKSPTDLLQVLTGEQNLINRIQSDPVIVSTFTDLVQKSFAAQVRDVEFLDTLLLFNSWVSKMIFKNLPNLYTAITKNKEKVGSKRRVDDDTNHGTKKKTKTKTKQKPNNNMLAQEAICEKNLRKYAAATAESSTTTSTVSSTATSTTRNVIPPSPDKIVNHLVKLPYKIKSAKVGASVAMSIGSEGEKSPIPLRSFLLDSRIDNSFWHAYRLRKNESHGHLFCPFCSISCDPKGFTNHSKSCNKKKKKK
jgi:hypothetical protein